MFNKNMTFFIFSLSLRMISFNFHHHNPEISYGIYNSNITENCPENYFSAGIHPKDITENWEASFEKIKKLSLLQNCLAIGECGLDGLVQTNENIQKEVFKNHIIWANEINKPVIIHCVKRFSELPNYKKLAKVPLIIHGFNKKKSIAKEMLKHGFYLSFGKSLLHNLSLQEILKEIPLNQMFLETDNSDLQIDELYLKASQIKGVSTEDLQIQILKNLELVNIKLE